MHKGKTRRDGRHYSSHPPRAHAASKAVSLAACEALEGRCLLAAAPVGGETLVMGVPSAYIPAVAVDADGDYVVAWSSRSDVFAQRFDRTGQPQGSEFQVNTTDDSSQDYLSPAIASDPAGNFVILWREHQTERVYARLFDASGQPRGADVPIVQAEAPAAVAMHDDGGFVIAWQDTSVSGAVYARRYDAGGDQLGADIRVDALSYSSIRSAPDIATNGSGDFVVTWGGTYISSGPRIRARMFNENGVAVGDEFLVNATEWTHSPKVTMDDAGAFVIAWTDPSGFPDRVQAQRFNAAGAAQGEAFQVNAAFGVEQLVDVASDADGDFAVLWRGFDGQNNRGIFLQRYRSTGELDGSNVRVNTTTEFNQNWGAVGLDPNGNTVVVWDQLEASYTRRVFSQHYAVVPEPPTVGGTIWNDGDGDGIREVGEAPRAGVTVTLYNDAGAMAETTTSAPDGTYRFTSVRPGDSYYVQIALPKGTVLTQRDQGADDTRDSDVDQVTLRTAPFVAPPAGQSNVTYDAGITIPGSISGIKFHDLDGDGVRSAGEPLLGGWTIYADRDDNGHLDSGEPSATTDNNGLYTMDGLAPGYYVVSEVPQPLWMLTTPPERRTGLVLPQVTTTNLNLGGAPSVPVTAARAVGHEFRANSFATGSQAAQAVARDAQGNYVVAWASANQDGHGLGIYAQRFDAAGAKVGGEFRVNSTIQNHQSWPAIGMAADGAFIVVWQSENQDGSGRGVYAQRYAADASPIGGEFLVNTFTSGDQYDPAVAVTPGGDVLVTWTSQVQDAGIGGVYGRWYFASTDTWGAETHLNTTRSSASYFSSASAAEDAGYLVTWMTGSRLVYARRFDTAGVPIGNDFLVAEYDSVASPTGAVAQDGSFAIAWQGVASGTAKVYLQRFDATGAKAGGALRVSTHPTSWQSAPVAGTDAAGDFVVLWHSDGGQDGNGRGVFGQRITATGVRQQPEFQVNTYTSGDQGVPALAVGDDGNFVAVWQSNGQDGSEAGVYGQRFEEIADPASVGGRVWDDIDGDGVRDENEPGRKGIVVNLLSPTGRVIETQATLADGTYRFIVLRPGTDYYVQVIKPAVSTFTRRDAGGDDARDSDFDGAGRSAAINLAAGEYSPALDAGLVAPASISGKKFNDLDGDGTRDASEPGLPGWRIYLDLDANGRFDSGEPASTTDSSGNFTVSGLLPGTYSLAEEPQDAWVRTTVLPTVTLSSGQSHIGVLVGARTDVVSDGALNAVGMTAWVSDPASLDDIRRHPVVATNASGSSVIVWTRERATPAGAVWQLYARRYGPDGFALGPEFALGEPVTTALHEPSIAMDGADRFVVVWHAPGADGRDVLVQRFDADGTPLGPVSGVNAYTADNQQNAVVGATPEGDFVVAWMSVGQDGDSSGVFAQRFDAGGNKVGPELQVNETTASLQYNPSIAVSSSGAFVIAWSGNAGSAGAGIVARRYAADGSPSSGELLVSTQPDAVKSQPSVAMDDSGAFVVAFQTSSPTKGIFARRFNAEGVPQGADLPVSVAATGSVHYADVAMDGAGGFAVSWAADTNSARSIVLRRFNAANVPMGPETQVGMVLEKAPAPFYVSLASDADGDLLVAWADGNARVHAQHYSRSAILNSVGGRAWNDVNADGMRQTTESTRDNVVVHLLDAQGRIVATTFTQDGGQYRFDNLTPGATHAIRVVSPAGLVPTTPDVGGDDWLDSDVDPVTGVMGPFTLTAGQYVFGHDVGLTIPGSLSGVRFNDLDGDGLRDAGEAGVPHRVIFIDVDADGLLDAGERWTLTDEQGAFAFTGLGQGTYRLMEQLEPHWALTAPQSQLVRFLQTGRHVSGVSIGASSDVPTTTATPVGAPASVEDDPGAYHEYLRSVGSDAAGNYVVAWQSAPFGGGGARAIFARRYDAAGQPLGPAFEITTQNGGWGTPVVAMAADGRFTLVWSARMAEGTTRHIFARGYGADGNPLGEPFQVSQHPAHDEPRAAMAPDGTTVIVWRSADGVDGDSAAVRGRLIAPDGAPVGAEFLVNTHTAGPQWQPDVAVANDGSFAVGWASGGRIDPYSNDPIPTQDGSDAGVYAQRFDASGNRVGSEFRLSTTTLGEQTRPSIAMNAAGEMFAVWQSRADKNGPYRVYAQRFAADGQKVGIEFLVSPSTATWDNAFPAVDMDAAGDAFITWTQSSNANSAPGQVWARRMTIAGATEGEPFPISGATSGFGQLDVALADGGDAAIVAWSSTGTQDVNAFVQRFTRYANPASIGGIAWSDSNADGVRDPGEVPLANLAVELLDASGAVVAHRRTGTDGRYVFERVKPGATYRVQVTLPSGKALTPADAGGDDDRDSDVDPYTRRTSAIVPGAGQALLSHDMGFVPAGGTSGVLFQDSDGDGMRDPGEQALSGWTVYLDADMNGQADALEPTAAVSDDGGFTFTGLSPGETRFGVVPQAGWTTTTAAEHRTIVIVAGQVNSGPNLGVSTAIPPYVVTAGDSGRRLHGDSAGRQYNGDLAVNAAGQAVALYGSDASIRALFAQRIAPDGTNLGEPVRVDPPNTTPPGVASVALAPDGSFVVAWDFGPDGQAIVAQRFDPAGNKIGSLIIVTSLPTGGYGQYNRQPDIIVDDQGGFVVVWEGYSGDTSKTGSDIYVQRFDATGAPIGGNTIVNEFTGGQQGNPRIVRDATGNYLVAWDGHAQRFDARGEKIGGQFDLGTDAARDVAMASDGAFVVVSHESGSPGEPDTIYAQRFDASGTQRGLPLQIGTVSSFYGATVAVDPEGNFVVVWGASNGSPGLYARTFSAAGGSASVPFRPDAAFPNGMRPRIAAGPDGAFLITWDRFGDGMDLEDVYVRRYIRGTAPTTTGLPDRTVELDAPTETLDLFAAFADVEESNAELQYTVHGNTTPDLFTSVDIDPATGRLTIDYAPMVAGTSLLTVRATDSGGGYADATFTVTVNPTLRGTAGNDTFYLREVPGQLQVFINAPTSGNPTYVVNKSLLRSLVIDGGDGDDTLMLDASFGNPVTLDGVTFTDSAGAEFVVITGASTGGAIILTPDSPVVLPATASLRVIDGAEAFFRTPRVFGSVFVDSTSRIDLGPDANSFQTDALDVEPGGTLDVRNGRLTIRASSATADAVLANVTGLLESARNSPAGRWRGSGIASSEAALDPLRGLSVVRTGDDVVVQYTYNGDANHDGRINADDYFRIDSGFIAQPGVPTYAQGDFNHDGRINADDYFLIDSSFLGQAPAASARSAGTVAASAGAMSTSLASDTAPPRLNAREQWKGPNLFSDDRIMERDARASARTRRDPRTTVGRRR